VFVQRPVPSVPCGRRHLHRQPGRHRAGRFARARRSWRGGRGRS